MWCWPSSLPSPSIYNVSQSCCSLIVPWPPYMRSWGIPCNDTRIPLVGSSAPSTSAWGARYVLDVTKLLPPSFYSSSTWMGVTFSIRGSSFGKGIFMPSCSRIWDKFLASSKVLCNMLASSTILWNGFELGGPFNPCKSLVYLAPSKVF